MASCTARRRASLTWGAPRRTRETSDFDTPARSATSRIVGAPAPRLRRAAASGSLTARSPLLVTARSLPHSREDLEGLALRPCSTLPWTGPILSNVGDRAQERPL